jgi:hypothetical protein
MKQIIRIAILMLGLVGTYAAADGGIPIGLGKRPVQLTMPGK